MDNEKYIPPATFEVQQEYQQKKRDLELAFKEFHKLVSNKILDKNKSPALKRTEMQVVTDLIKAAQALDKINVGEGMLVMVSMALREQLVVRDRVNELEFELCKAIRDLNELKEKVSQSNGSKQNRKT